MRNACRDWMSGHPKELWVKFKWRKVTQGDKFVPTHTITCICVIYCLEFFCHYSKLVNTLRRKVIIWLASCVFLFLIVYTICYFYSKGAIFLHILIFSHKSVNIQVQNQFIILIRNNIKLPFYPYVLVTTALGKCRDINGQRKSKCEESNDWPKQHKMFMLHLQIIPWIKTKGHWLSQHVVEVLWSKSYCGNVGCGGG